METTNTENLQRPRYIKLINADDEPIKKESDRLMEHFHYPKKPITNFGNAGLWLRRDIDEEEIAEETDEQVFVVQEGNLVTMSKVDALHKGLFDLELEITNPTVRHRGIHGRVFVSLDEKSDACVSDIFNDSLVDEEDSKKELEGKEMHTIFWAGTNDTAQNRRLGLYVKNDPAILSNLNFRFELVDASKGGDN